MPGSEICGLLISCEHGGNRIPRRYVDLFAGRRTLLSSHRGYDRGALRLARSLALELEAPLVVATVSRLLVDLNRSSHNPAVFSKATQGLERREREQLIARYHAPHRTAIEERVRATVDSHGPLLHLAVHTFTPVLAGRTRNAEVGLLYDPRRESEKSFCVDWQHALQVHMPSLRVRRNYPYRGSNDGITTHLRSLFSEEQYLGIELEVNQRRVSGSGALDRDVYRALLNSLAVVLAETELDWRPA